ncbi:MAG: SDR family NAD(P)-dependent oxidoreductase [Pseudomonadales bacterium]|nr:SDR family NAD(P)-dependent oxidoreductase [Pseudomonadales bacterium]
MKISDKTILVTGGATGIGLELVRQLAAQGNQLLICGRRQSKLDEAAAQVPGLITFVCDVAEPDQCQRLLEAIKAKGLAIDILVNNAAIISFEELDKPGLDISNVSNVLNANVLGPITLTNLLLPDLLVSKAGMVINICSPAGRCPVALLPLYSATKAALDSYTRSLRFQLQGKLKVVEVFPPSVDTEMVDDIQSASGMLITPKTCATRLIKGLEKGKSEIWIGFEANIFRMMDQFLHWTIFNIVNGKGGISLKSKMSKE